MSPVSRHIQKPMAPISTMLMMAPPKGVGMEWELWKANMEANKASSASRAAKVI